MLGSRLGVSGSKLKLRLRTTKAKVKYVWGQD
jgi:hypothetical protein